MATEVLYTQKITPVETCNIELWIAYAKFNRYIREVNECNSANINQVSVPDMIRFRSYLADWRAYIENVAKVYAVAGQMTMAATVTALIRHRLDQPAWAMKDTAGLHRVLFQAIWGLAQQEEDAEGFAEHAGDNGQWIADDRDPASEKRPFAIAPVPLLGPLAMASLEPAVRRLLNEAPAAPR
jgi:hypothetical protein